MTIRTPDDEVKGWLYPPFREDWTYHGATYAGHSDYSVDWNRRTPSGGWVQDEGDPVLAIADGRVSVVDKADGLVMVDHGPLLRSESRHMSDIVVKVGQRVQRSDRLGRIGNVAGSGASFGAHLHHVHWRRAKAGDPWQRAEMMFEGKPVATSVGDSDSRPDGWVPPAPVAVVGPPRKATWEGAFREASRTITKLGTKLDEQKAQTALAIDERDQARRELAACIAQDCGPVRAALDQANAEVARLSALRDRIHAEMAP